MSINWKKKQEKRYEEPRHRLSRLFCFIFINLNNSPINFEICSSRGNKTRKIQKDYDVCLLVSLSILKLVANFADNRSTSNWEPFQKCTDEELLLMWYGYFGDNHFSDDIKNTIPKERREEIKVPDACAGFYDESRQKEVRKNNLGNYLNTIPKKKIKECIGYLFGWLDNYPKERIMRISTERMAFSVFLRNFIKLINVPIQSNRPFATKEVLDKLKYPYYFEKCGGNSKLWEYLCTDFSDEVDANIPGTNLKRFTDYDVNG